MIRSSQTVATALSIDLENPTLEQLLQLSQEQLAKVDIAVINLRCAEGLPGSEGLDIPAVRQRLDDYAKHIDQETVRHLYRFRKNPAEFENSEAYFRMLVLAVVLREEFNIRYNPKRLEPLDDFQPDKEFCADSKDVFLHGLTGPTAMGTCASMPVLYVAVGRRLGYPLSLVTTKNHLFLRWEDDHTRLNVEATTHGFASYDDDYYKTWPFKITDQEIEADGYLKSMTPNEDLACFLNMRGPCLMNVQRHSEAIAVHREAVRVAPHLRIHHRMFDGVQRLVRRRLVHEANLRIDGFDYAWEWEEQMKAARRQQAKEKR
jgi:hypothetical protein